MATKLIRLEDDTLVEVETLGDQVQQISGGMADKVGATFNKIQPLLTKVWRPIIAALKEIQQDQNSEIEQVEAELGLSFEAEGNLYITKAKVDANLIIRFSFKSKE